MRNVIDRLYMTPLPLKTRSFNHIRLDRRRGILTKTSEDKEKLIHEIEWYLKLPADLEYLHPRIFSYSLDSDNPYVNMEYYAYHTLHELYLYGELEEKHWRNIFQCIRFVLADMGRYEVRDENIVASLEDMYINKTIRRMEKVREKGLGNLDLSQPLLINGCRYKSWEGLMALLPALIRGKLLACSCFTIIHGDLCFTNILVDANDSFVKCVDPRGRFGKFDIYGDRRYEFAKLLHSIDGKYDYIIKEHFDMDVEGNELTYHFKQQEDVDVYGIFLDVFQDEVPGCMEELKILEALLFFSMIPLHDESWHHQLMMLAAGVRLLNEVTDITC